MVKQQLLREFLPFGLPWAKKQKCGVCHSEAYSDRSGRRDAGTDLHGASFCSPKCFEVAVLRELERLAPLKPGMTRQRKYRLPLGLLMLSHGMIERNELASALEAQRTTGTGRIGEWLQRLGYASEVEITRALSIQWGVPMLAENATSLSAGDCVPAAILKDQGVLPVHRSLQQNKLYVACSNEIDRAMLYQIEQMLGCAIVPCVATASAVGRELNRLLVSNEKELLFEADQSCMEMARICCSYATQSRAVELRMVRCGRHIWARLQRAKGSLDLLFRIRTS